MPDTFYYSTLLNSSKQFLQIHVFLNSSTGTNSNISLGNSSSLHQQTPNDLYSELQQLLFLLQSGQSSDSVIFNDMDNHPFSIYRCLAQNQFRNGPVPGNQLNSNSSIILLNFSLCSQNMRWPPRTSIFDCGEIF